MNDIKEKIIKKINKEYENFINKLNTREKLYDHIYEVVDKQNIVYSLTLMLEEKNMLSNRQMIALYKSNNILNEIYNDYSSADYDIFSDLRESIVYTSNVLLGKQKMEERL